MQGHNIRIVATYNGKYKKEYGLDYILNSSMLNHSITKT